MIEKHSLKNILSHPNTLTIFRITVVPIVVILLLFPNRFTAFFASLLFGLAAITDFLDGYIARLRGLESSFGKIMDPLADKLLVSSALIMMIPLGWVPAWMICVIIGRELAITGLRNFITKTDQDVAASSLGKYKTGFQIAAIIPLLLNYTYFNINFHMVGYLFLWIALVLTVWSGVDYLFRFRKLLKIIP